MTFQFFKLSVKSFLIVIIMNIFNFEFVVADSNIESVFLKGKKNFFQNKINQENSEVAKESLTIGGFFMGLNISEIAQLSRIKEIAPLQEKFFELYDTIDWPKEKVELNSLIVIRKESMKSFTSDLLIDEGDSLIYSIREFYKLLPLAQKIPIIKLVEVAKDLLIYLRSDPSFGELYDVVYHDRFLSFFRKRIVYLPNFIQKEIDFEFNNEKLVYKNEKNIEMTKLIRNKNLTPSEANELVALSRSTQIFEQSNSLVGDLGGWIGNFKGIFASGEVQTFCHEEALMYYFFTKTLSARGSLRFFKPVGTILRLGHEATLIQNQRTKNYFVLDSWPEDGGSLAHILTKEDWAQRFDDKNLISTLYE